MKRFLSDSYRRTIDNRINRIVVAHKSPKATSRPQTSLNRSLNNPILDHSFTPERAKFIYYQKCDELEIAPNSLAEKKFIDQLMNSIKQKSLIFSGLGLGPAGMKGLIGLIAENDKYIFLDLSMNQLQDDGAYALASYLNTNPPLIHIDLRSTGINVDGSINIFNSLRKNTHLVSLDYSAIDGIDRNRVGTKGCQYLAALIEQTKTISHLNLSMSGISIDGCAYISKALSRNDSLIFIDFSANRFGSTGCQNLFCIQNSFAHLETIVLSKNGITDSASAAICKQIESSSTITTIDLSDNTLGKGFLRRLLQALQTNSSLKNISLAKNKIGSESADLLHLIIRDSQSLRSLNLSLNPIKDIALKQIAEPLIEDSCLVSLDISDTMMTDESAVMFAEVIAKNNHIQRLQMNSNRLTDVSGVPIAKALGKNTTLVALGLKNNELKDESAVIFLETLLENQTITDLEVDYNDFTYRSHVQLTQSIEDHKKSIHQNIAILANKHIENLKQDEQKLFECRDEVKKQTDAVHAAEAEKERKTILLESLTERRTNEIANADTRLEEIKKEYEEIAEERRRQLVEFNRLKTEAEEKQQKALSSYQNIAAKRQHAQARVKRAEEKKLDAEIQSNRVLDDLKVHLLTIKEQLRQAINDAHAAQNSLFQKEADDLAQQEMKEVTEQLLSEDKVGSPKGKVSVRKVPIKKLSTKEQRLQKVISGRPRTAANAPVVTPQFEGETK